MHGPGRRLLVSESIGVQRPDDEGGILVKHLSIAMVAFGCVVLFAAISCAQGLRSEAMPIDGPLSTESRGSAVTAGGYGCGWCEPKERFTPRIFVGWSPNASSIKLAATASAYLDPSYGLLAESTIEWSTRGVWLGLSLPLPINERLSADLQGWYFFPGNRHVEISARASLFTEEDALSAALANNPNISTRWCAADLEGSYRTSPGFSILAGVRYDYLQGTISLPQSFDQLLPVVYPGIRSKLDVNLNSLFPYVGFRTLVSVPAGSLNLSVKAFPWAVSVADVRPTSGYFAELFCSYDVMPLRALSLSVFAKADIAHAVFQDLTQVAYVFNAEGSIPENAPVQENLPVTWQQFILGGLATMYFDLSFL